MSDELPDGEAELSASSTSARPWLRIGLAAAVVITIVMVVLALSGIFSGSSSRKLGGTLTLHDPDASWTAGETCSGSDGYSDLREGGNVVVKNENGKIIGTGSLTAGVGLGSTRCSFVWGIGKLPEADFYTVEITHRGELRYSKSELKSRDWFVQSSLGD